MDAVETMTSHQSIRNFLDRSINADEMRKIEDAIIQTSSSLFLQVVTTIKISDKEKLAKIAALSGNQAHIANCSHFLLFCLDASKLMHLGAVKPPFSFKFLFMGLNDCSLACQSALTAAEAQGLGGVVIGGYKNGIKEISEMLKLPKGVVPLLGLCLGVPNKDFLEEQKPRLPRHWLIMDEEFKDPFNEEELKAYDEETDKYYQNRKYNQRSEKWSEAARKLSERQSNATAIIEYLESQGFEYF